MTDESACARARTEARRRRQRGLTLVELMVVIAIIGLIASLVAFNVFGAFDQASGQAARTDVNTLSSAVQQYRLDMGELPDERAGLEALLTAPSGARRPERYRPGGYVQKLPDDPWGRPYIYAYPGEFGEFDIYTLGRDGEPGGDGPDADIGSWE